MTESRNARAVEAEAEAEAEAEEEGHEGRETVEGRDEGHKEGVTCAEG